MVIKHFLHFFVTKSIFIIFVSKLVTQHLLALVISHTADLES